MELGTKSRQSQRPVTELPLGTLHSFFCFVRRDRNSGVERAANQSEAWISECNRMTVGHSVEVLEVSHLSVTFGDTLGRACRMSASSPPFSFLPQAQRRDCRGQQQR